jgi:hypothetical protein
MDTTTQPVNTTAASTETTGECFIPDVFADDLTRLMAALDWSRVFNTSQEYGSLSQELAAARRHALALAELCEDFSRAAFELER